MTSDTQLQQLPKFNEYLWPTLCAVKDGGGSATLDEIEDFVAGFMLLSDVQLEIPHGDTTRSEFQYRLAWARTYLKWADALANSGRGVWAITEKGESLVEGDMEELVKLARANSPKRPKKPSNELSDDTDEEQNWVTSLLRVLGEMDPSAFERLSQRLLRESGFTRVEVTGRPSDGGIDGIGVLRMNLVSFQVLFQCKRWKGSVGAPTVRDFRGAMVGRADKGLIITTGNFTADARKEATRDGAPTIDLIDGELLCDLIKDRELGLRIKMVEAVEIDESFFKSI